MEYIMSLLIFNQCILGYQVYTLSKRLHDVEGIEIVQNRNIVYLRNEMDKRGLEE